MIRYSTITPYLTVENARESISFYAKAFGFKLINQQDGPLLGEGEHVEMSYKDVLIMLAP